MIEFAVCCLVGMVYITYCMAKDSTKIEWHIPEKSALEKKVEERQMVKRKNRDA